MKINKAFIILCCLTAVMTSARAQTMAKDEQKNIQQTETIKRVGFDVFDMAVRSVETVIADLAISVRSSRDITSGLNSFTAKYTPSGPNFRKVLKNLQLGDYCNGIINSKEQTKGEKNHLEDIVNIFYSTETNINDADMADIIEYITTVSHHLIYSTSGTYEQMNSIIDGKKK